MTDVFGYGNQSVQLCSKDHGGNLSMDEGIALTETQSIKIGDIIAAIPADGEAGMQEFAHLSPHVGFKEEQRNFINGPTSSNSLHLAWSETGIPEEESGSYETTTSLDMMNGNVERSNMKQENSELLQFLVNGIGGSVNDVELTVNPWTDLQNQITESCSFRNPNEQVLGECHQFNETPVCNNYNYYGQAMPSYSAVQPCSSISVVQNVGEMAELSRECQRMKIECIGTGGPAISRPEAVINELTKQDERKQKRRERNRVCSRQFRQKQKVKERTLTEGLKVKKAQLKDLHLKLEGASKLVFKMLASSSAACNKGKGMINAVAGLVNKENWPGGMQVVFANTSQVKQ